MSEIVDLAARRETKEQEALPDHQERLISCLRDMLTAAEDGDLIGLQYVAVTDEGVVQKGVAGNICDHYGEVFISMETIKKLLLGDFESEFEGIS